MPERCAVLLRGVNVGKHNRIAMADLSALLADLGATEVRTLLQSGNAVLTAEPEGLAQSVETALRERLDLPVRVLVRTRPEVDAVVAGCPWPEKAETDPKMLHVAFLEHPADPAAVRALGLRHGDDEIAVGERDLYLSYARTSFDSPINKVLAQLPGVASTRNWNTVRKIQDLLALGS